MYATLWCLRSLMQVGGQQGSILEDTDIPSPGTVNINFVRMVIVQVGPGNGGNCTPGCLPLPLQRCSVSLSTKVQQSTHIIPGTDSRACGCV